MIKTINHDFDVVDDIAIELDFLVQIAHCAVYPNARKTLLANIDQDLDLWLPFLPMDHWRQHLNPTVRPACSAL